MNSKLLLGVLILSSVLGYPLGHASFAIAQTTGTLADCVASPTISCLTYWVNQITAEITALQTQSQSWCYTFTTPLGYANSNSSDVVQLHTALQKLGYSYAPDDINTYSDGTSQALIQFQKANSISPQSGYFGKLTMSIMNAQVKCAQSISVCTSFTYSDWSACGQGGVQIRTVSSSSPIGCDGGNPVLTQSCVYNSTNAAKWVPFLMPGAYMRNCSTLCGSIGGKCDNSNGGKPDLSTLTTTLYDTVYDCLSNTYTNTLNSDTIYCPCSGAACVAQGGILKSGSTCCAGLIGVVDWKNKSIHGDAVSANTYCETPVPSLNCADKGEIPTINGFQKCCPGLFAHDGTGGVGYSSPNYSADNYNGSCQTLVCNTCLNSVNKSNCASLCTSINRCGNNICESNIGETAQNCPYDCASVSLTCGNGVCDPGETIFNCSNDCKQSAGNLDSTITITSANTVSVNGTLQMSAQNSLFMNQGEEIIWSVNNGTGSAYIDGMTGLLTGKSPGTVTVKATLNIYAKNFATKQIIVTNSCTPNCPNSYSYCGASDGCGGTCQSSCLTSCGNGICNNGKTVANCPQDCAPKKIPVSIITVSGPQQYPPINVFVGSSIQMNATISPSNATNQTVTWSVVSDGGGLATIDPLTGVLIGTGAGVVQVWATAADGSGVKGVNYVGVKIPVSNIIVTAITTNQYGAPPTTSVSVGTGIQMIATIPPATFGSSDVTWSVASGTGSATIANNDDVKNAGWLVGVSLGTVTVTATANDGSGTFGSEQITVTN